MSEEEGTASAVKRKRRRSSLVDNSSGKRATGAVRGRPYKLPTAVATKGFTISEYAAIGDAYKAEQVARGNNKPKYTTAIFF